jgi:DNA-binding response OmpR family regulator
MPTESLHTVMVVDDEPDVRNVIVRVLAEAGFTVTGAGSAREALSRFGDDIGAMVVDVRMPEVSGPELARRAWARRPGVPVLFVSANPESPARDAGLLQNCLLKPFSPDQLVAAVRRLMPA